MSTVAIYVLLSIGCALAFAVAAALQQFEAAKQPADQELKIGLLGRLLKKPIWLAGIGAQVVGYVMQLVALGLGPIVVVEPIRALQIVFALPLGIRFTHQTATRRDWLSALLITAGIAVFIIVADPRGGETTPGWYKWVIATAVVVGVGVGCVVAGKFTTGGARSALWGTAAGIFFGFQIALLKRVTITFTQGGDIWNNILDMLTEPFVYGAIIFVITGFLLVQSAFQAGSLENTIASYTALDVIVSVMLGVYLFEEQLNHEDWRIAVIILSFIAIIVGIVMLARSKALAIGAPPPEDGTAEKAAAKDSAPRT